MSQLDELKQIIVGDSAHELAELKERIENIESRARDVQEVLAPAIDAGVKKDDRLIKSLQAPVSESLKQAIRAEPKAYGEILYPVMGPAIRRAIAQAISSLLKTINQTMESTTTLNGLKLRFQAKRLGIPYGELALRESLEYRVEHIYLIHSDSGLLITETSDLDSNSLDSDAVSAMFSAIQSFVQDSFSQNPEDRLTDFKVGEHNIWLAHGEKTILACVIFGDAPESLKYYLYDTLDDIRSEYSQQISQFNGDSSDFFGVEQKLDPLLQSRIKDGENKKTERSWSSRIIAVIAILCFLALTGYFINKRIKLNTVEHYLGATPGLVLMDSYWEEGSIIFEGLQDPYAEIPYSTLEKNGVDIDKLELRTVPFQSLEPAVELNRVLGIFDPPDGVLVELQQDIIKISGSAPIDWLIENDLQLRQWSTSGRIEAKDLIANEQSVLNYLTETGYRGGQSIRERSQDLSETPWLELNRTDYLP